MPSRPMNGFVEWSIRFQNFPTSWSAIINLLSAITAASPYLMCTLEDRILTPPQSDHCKGAMSVAEAKGESHSRYHQFTSGRRKM